MKNKFKLKSKHCPHCGQLTKIKTEYNNIFCDQCGCLLNIDYKKIIKKYNKDKELDMILENLLNS